MNPKKRKIICLIQSIFQCKNFRVFVFLVLMALRLFTVTGQSIVDKLDKASRSSINAFALTSKGIQVDTARGFFISADGLAITTASLFQNGDTVVFTDDKEKPLDLHRIIAIHSYSNLALIQLKNPRTKDIDFLVPSRKPFNSQGDILAFTNPKDAEKGLGYGVIGTILRAPFIGRFANIEIEAGAASECSPIVNSSGDFIGFYYFTNSNIKGNLLPTSLITDDNWVSINQTWTIFKNNPLRKSLTTPLYSRALINQGQGNWLESARIFTSLLKIIPDDALIHALRSLSRFNYGNNIGGREDFTYSIKLNPNGYYPYYSRAHSFLNERDKEKAMDDLFKAIDKNPNFSDAFLEIGRIQSFFGEVKMAVASYTYALETDSLLAEAWYERGRLFIQHSSNQDKALIDLATAARLNPALPGVYTLIGNIKLSRQDYLEAIFEFDKAINQNGKDTHALMNRGMAHFNTGLKEKACDDWDKAGRQGNLQAFKLISRHCAELRKGTFTRGN